MPKNMCKIYNKVSVLFQRNWARKAETIIFGEIWSSQPKFWKVAVLKNVGKFSENCLKQLWLLQPAILLQADLQKRWL